MTDPLSLVALGAAVGGAAGKFVEKAWDSGEKWLTSYFANHREKSQDRARENAARFLNDVAHEINARADLGDIPPEAVESAQDHPDFSSTLQAALLSASQTDSDDKHKVLARLIAERLAVSPESTVAVASKIAANAIASATSTQLRVLGLQVNILFVIPTVPMSEDRFTEFLTRRLAPYAALVVKPIDLLHLEALSCGRIEQFLGRNLIAILSSKSPDAFNEERLDTIGLLPPIRRAWEDGLQKFNLTSVGQIIGFYVSDIVCGGRTSLRNWGA